jgi:protein-glucosylgalactosylhydroxylysine glucosidase
MNKRLFFTQRRDDATNRRGWYFHQPHSRLLATDTRIASQAFSFSSVNPWQYLSMLKFASHRRGWCPHQPLLKLSLILLLWLVASITASSQKINRRKLVQRHNVIVTKADSLSSLTVGNGGFAFTVDVTGLQTFPKEYEKGVCLGTQSEWGWHSFPDTIGYKREETYKPFHLNGRDITYTTQWNSPERNKAAANWFRQNPHRLQLANIGFELIKKDGSLAQLSDIQNIRQELVLWTGEIKSHFTLENIPVDVSTFCNPGIDAISVSAVSPLILEGRLKIRLVFPYPTGEWTDAGTKWTDDAKHVSLLLQDKPMQYTHQEATIMHQLDSTKYYVWTSWRNKGEISKAKDHYFLVTPSKEWNSFSFTARFMQSNPPPPVVAVNPFPGYNETRFDNEHVWPSFWLSGGAIDFSGSKDPRAFELERRIILSQYLMRAQEAGYYPPQETGLTYNSWFGKPHLEMTWWHAAHWALWGRPQLLEKNMEWYRTVAPKAKAIAARQGFDGVRWQKMTDNTGDETPSSVGALLIWQQPHFIYFAELLYRSRKDHSILEKYKDLVFATADFMASFPYYDSARQRYILGKGLIPAQERFKAEETFNPPYELVYWHWALKTAQEWRERLQLPRNKKWDEVLAKLSPLPIQNNKYLFTESASDSYTNPEFRTDHPAVLGAWGMMPLTGQVDTSIMHNTFDWIWNNWSWKETWGWDFPLVAMTTIRMGNPEKTIDALLMDIQTNRYLVNGHNYQDDRLRIYMPGNGGLLATAALMCAGYDGCKESNPGIPKDGKWKVRWEGLARMP